MKSMSKTILLMSMLVMLICCVSAVSATDADNITVPDDTDVIEIDDTVDSVEEVEQDRGTGGCDCNDCNCVIEVPTIPSGTNKITLTPSNYTTKFTNGQFNDENVDEVIFNGEFSSASFTTLKFNQAITITATGSTFNNMGFELLHNGIVLNGATIVVNAPQYQNCYAIDIQNANNAIVINNKVNYTCNYDNAANYNYVIKAGHSQNLTIYGNEINANVPLKQVNWTLSGSIYADYVAGAAIEYCNNLKFDKNNLTVIGNRRVGDYPTLDAFIITQSTNAKIRGNNIYETDPVTPEGSASYLYGIDVYSCYNITICSNTVDMNGNKTGSQLVGGNGTGAAYCIQLTGPHTGVKICNNNLTTKNQGPNLGIYSQNYYGKTNITVCGNHISVTGKAGSDPWSLVSGMELQDTYATVCGNTINVTNVGGHVSGACVYGISYSQSTSGNHTYNITNNTVNVNDGDWAVFLNGVVNSIVTNNWLYANVNVGDNAVNIAGTGTGTGNFPGED